MCYIKVLEFTVGPNSACVCEDVACLLEFTVGPAVSERGRSAA